jgi:transposase
MAWRMENRPEAVTVAATRTKSESRIEIVAERRRKHDEALRAEMVALSMAPGASVQALARQHGLAPSLIYRWRRLASRQAAPPIPEVRLLPVQIAKSPTDRPCGSKPAGLIEIELANGNRVRVDAAVNVAALRRVLSVVRG